MSEPLPGGRSSSSAMPERLREIARLLREIDHVGPEAKQQLAELADELGRTLAAPAVSSAESAHLTDSAAHLIESLHRKEGGSKLAAARDRLEEAVLGAEAQSPFLAGVARRLLDALAGLGI